MSGGSTLPPPPTDDRDRRGLLVSASRYFQRNLSNSAPVAAASYTLIGAILLLGALGYAADSWLGTSPWLLLLGLLLGIVVGFYELARTVWGRQR
jgi:F0F1-type ATP synthase assembly protein I